jgi:hypothetical protein
MNTGYGANTGSYGTQFQNSNSESSAFSFMWFIGGIVVVGIIIAVVYFVVGRAETRPIKQGFVGTVNGTSALACGRMSSEAEALFAMFYTRCMENGTEGSTDLRDLRDLLSKMCCMKQDLMSPQNTITAVKELGFATHMDIQPVADLVGRCFSKTIPERDLSIQFIKWRDFGGDLIRRLCTATNMTDAEHSKAEQLFLAAWKDAYDVASIQCLSGPPQGPYKTSRHEPAASTDEGDESLRPYDGYY